MKGGHNVYKDDSYIGRLPLNDQKFNGGFYPPPPLDPSSYGDPYGSQRPESVVSTPTDDTDRSWRRRQTIKRGVTRKVKLTNGNFIAEYPVPTAVFSAMEPKYKTAVKTTEFSHMRYTAATCDPDEFTEANGWSLRQKIYNRDTEILISVTLYNEDKTLYGRTLQGVMTNIRDICLTKRSKYRRRQAEQGNPGWKKITVALIVDGLEPMDKGVLDILGTIGVYQDGVMKRQVDGKDTVAHIFEYTTQLSVDAKLGLVLPQSDDPNNLVPVQIILVLKAKNQKKINSHRWLFNAIGKMLHPEICVLIDVGTRPNRKSILYLWEAFYNDSHLGGCCGEVHVMTKGGKKLWNPLVAAQNFEYKMSNILDKLLESSFGFVTVLPGAFSAYRFRAILGSDAGRSDGQPNGPLEQYFLGDPSLPVYREGKGNYDMHIFTKNRFLAEDRVLCFELVTKADDHHWTLAYVKHSKAETDVPETTAELISQRRRWLNGSFTASVHSIINFCTFYRSNHGVVRMFFFHVQALYNLFQLLFSWFALANLWLTFSIIINLLPDQGIYVFGTANTTHRVHFAFNFIYLSFLALQFIFALGSQPKRERILYIVTFWVYAFLAVYVLICSFWLTARSFAVPKILEGHITPLEPVGALIIAMISTFGIYLIASILYGDLWHILGFLQYLCIVPSFINIIHVYAFCNLHDVSWGTKGNNKTEGASSNSPSADALECISAQKSKDGEEVVVEVTVAQEDLDVTFKDTVTRTIWIDKKQLEKPNPDDQNKTFRTVVLVFWVLTNTILALAVSGVRNAPFNVVGQDLGKRQKTYFVTVLYSTFALSLVKFFGFLYYNIKLRWFRTCFS